jgi:hypothetical protein
VSDHAQIKQSDLQSFNNVLNDISTTHSWFRDRQCTVAVEVKGSDNEDVILIGQYNVLKGGWLITFHDKKANE